MEEKSWFIDMKQRFDDELSKIRVNAAKNSLFLTETTYQKLINDVQKAKIIGKKEPRDYWLLNRYDVMVVENKIKLIYPVKEGVSSIQYYVTDSELFHVLHEAHLAIGHGGRDRMVKELSPKYKNVTRHDIELYIHLCELCQKKQKGNESKEKCRILRNKYHLSEIMKFPLPFVEMTETSSRSLRDNPSNISKVPDLPSVRNLLKAEHETPNSIKNRLPQQPLSISTPSPSQSPTSSSSDPIKRKRQNTASVDIDKTITDYFLAKKKKEQAIPKQIEPLKMFLLNLIPDLEALTPIQIRTFKRMTLTLIEELSNGVQDMLEGKPS